MFTGIVEETGVVERVRQGASGIHLVVRANRCGRGAKVGDSFAVNGCCLTAVKLDGPPARRRLHFDLLRETWRRTNLQFGRPGCRVNLERALRANDRLGGHFVTGHIDGLGRVRRWERAGPDWSLEVAAPPDVMRYVVFKGAIAVDGISLTVAAVRRGWFRLWIIPHTWEVTSLSERSVGDAVNLEADLLAKYVDRLWGNLRC